MSTSNCLFAQDHDYWPGLAVRQTANQLGTPGLRKLAADSGRTEQEQAARSRDAIMRSTPVEGLKNVREGCCSLTHAPRGP